MAGSVKPFFVRRPGQEQGRVEDPSGFSPPPEGDHAMVFGANRAAWARRFNVGDRFDLFQSDSVGAAKLLRFQGRIRGPSRMPALSAEEPFALADGQTLQLRIDGGTVQTITFLTAEFASIGAATALEVRDAINTSLTDAEARLTGDDAVAIFSDSSGRRSRVEVVGGTANPALNFRELAWAARLLVAGTLVADVELRPGEVRDLSDMAGNLAAHGDPAEVRFRLEVVVK